mgnify:CR=1 FL=1
MQLDKLHEELGLIAEQVKRCIQASMEKNGVNDKINENTLIDSHIYDELDVSDVDLELIKVLINDYYEFIEGGMKPGHWVDEEYLLPWMQDKGIPTDNNTLLHIQDSIYRFGISPRPFLDDAWAMVEDYWDEWADGIFDILMEDINDWFEN